MGGIRLYGVLCGEQNLTEVSGPWHLPRVRSRPSECFDSMLSEHCCQPLRPQCWGHNMLLAMACCAVAYEEAPSCLLSNAIFPNANQDCRGQPLNFFRAFNERNEVRIVVGGRLGRPEVNASLAAGCLFQSIIYLFHELHHLGRDVKLLEALEPQQLFSYTRLFQAGVQSF